MSSKTFQRPINLVYKSTTTDPVVLNVVSEVPADGTDDFLFIHQVRDSDGVEKTDFKATYDSSSGTVTVEADGSVAIASGDIVTVIGTFYR